MWYLLYSLNIILEQINIENTPNFSSGALGPAYDPYRSRFGHSSEGQLRSRCDDFLELLASTLYEAFDT